jgi:phenylacetate-CoA ligase
VARLTPEELPALPVTPKQDLRHDPEAFVATGARGASRLLRYATSGSTGTPITAICTADGHRRFLAAREVRSFGWAGASIRGPRAMMGGRMVVPAPDSRGPFYRYNHAERQVYFSAYHISPANAPGYVEGIRRYRPPLFTGYAHSYYFLARLMLAQGLEIGYQPRCLVLSSEKTTLEMKDAIARAFGARAWEEYGSVENCALATECEHGRLHVSPDFGIVEIVDERGFPAPFGTHGRVLATGLLNEAQPLIRYDIGDIAAWSGERCPCGRDQLPVLSGIDGRLEDTVVGPDGREMVRFHGLFISVPGVVEAQVIQEEIDLLRVRVVATPEFGEAQRKLIEARVHERLGAVRVIVETTGRIERTSRGKFRAVISRLRTGAADARQPTPGEQSD